MPREVKGKLGCAADNSRLRPKLTVKLGIQAAWAVLPLKMTGISQDGSTSVEQVGAGDSDGLTDVLTDDNNDLMVYNKLIIDRMGISKHERKQEKSNNTDCCRSVDRGGLGGRLVRMAPAGICVLPEFRVRSGRFGAPGRGSTGPVYYTNRVAILTYHNFDENETGTTISPQHFREHLETLKIKGYNFISLDELGDFLAGKPGLPPNAVAITFDDGYESVYRYAFPVLLEKGLPAAVFVIVKNVGATENQIPKCTWAEMQEMQASGLQFYSHSYDSHHLVAKKDGTLGPALTTSLYLPAARREENRVEYEDRIMQDLLISKIILENALHSKVNFLALPYGARTSFVQQNARLAGYKYIFTVEPGLASTQAPIPWP